MSKGRPVILRSLETCDAIGVPRRSPCRRSDLLAEDVGQKNALGDLAVFVLFRN